MRLSFSFRQQVFVTSWEVPNALVESIRDKVCDKGGCCSIGEKKWGNL
jgi:hypothetical protein